jgi:hypothetical protein
MEEKSVTLTLDDARKLYGTGDESLMGIALMAFKQEDLVDYEWENIKTFEDACKYLGVDGKLSLSGIDNLPERERGQLEKHLMAIYKIDIIRMALNNNHDAFINSLTYYVPDIRLYLFHSPEEAKETVKKIGLEYYDQVRADGNTYYFVTGDYDFTGKGVADFEGNYGHINATLGLFRCSNARIAKHFGKYFAREIFEAAYAMGSDYYFKY